VESGGCKVALEFNEISEPFEEKDHKMSYCPFLKEECRKVDCELWVEIYPMPKKHDCVFNGILAKLDGISSIPNEIMGQIAMLMVRDSES
jgi:hypothetical protein